MTIYSENIFMASSFATVNKILKEIDRQMDNESFDSERFSAESFGISKPRFARILSMLVKAKYIEGVKITDNGERDSFDSDSYERFTVECADVTLTFSGMQFLMENTMVARAYKTIKSVKDLIP